MGIEHGSYQDDLSLHTGSVVAHTPDEQVWLISDVDHVANGIPLSQLDSKSGRLRIHDSDPVGNILQYTDMVFDQFSMARLAYGLWERCGPFGHPKGQAIPIEVATDSQAAIAAYLRVGNGYPNSRGYVAEQMGLTEQTVSNYCNRVRWTPSDRDRPTNAVGDPW